ncbi:MAG: hypothetical protein AB1696_27555 [Planctomycetota bacterium]
MREATNLLAAALLLAAGMAGAALGQQADAPDPFGEATIRVKGFARVPPGQPLTGAAKLGAMRAAKVVAMRNLAALFGNMEITGDEKVKKIVVEGFVSGAQDVGEPEVRDGWLIVTVEVPLSAVAANMADLEAKVAQAQERNEQMQQALGQADASLTKLRETLDKLKAAIDAMEKRMKEKGK